MVRAGWLPARATAQPSGHLWGAHLSPGAVSSHRNASTAPLSFSSDKVHPAGVRVPDGPGFSQEDGGSDQEEGAVQREVAAGVQRCLRSQQFFLEATLGIGGERETRGPELAFPGGWVP